MENTKERLIQLLSSEVCGSTLSLCSPVTHADTAQMLAVSKVHDITHIIGSALISNRLLDGDPLESIYRECVYSTMYRYEIQCYVLEKISKVLEDAKIPYIPLKGAVIREFYPQPWMRTGCDIDILVHEENIDNAATAIVETLGYEYKSKGKHDIQILSAESIYIELHFSLLEEDASPEMAKVLATVWKHAKPVQNGKYRYELDDAMFYFYHIAHMAKHFLRGGCGIRPFADIWLMKKSKNYNTAETRALLKKGKLTDFAEAAEKLSRIWFSQEEHDSVTKLMEDFVLFGGCFGSKETRMLSSQQKSGGRKKYILSRIFVPYDELKNQYPIIKKYKILTPICEICRVFSLLFGKKRNFRKNYMRKLNGVSEKYLDDFSFMFESVGL